MIKCKGRALSQPRLTCYEKKKGHEDGTPANACAGGKA